MAEHIVLVSSPNENEDTKWSRSELCVHIASTKSNISLRVDQSPKSAFFPLSLCTRYVCASVHFVLLLAAAAAAVPFPSRRLRQSRRFGSISHRTQAHIHVVHRRRCLSLAAERNSRYPHRPKTAQHQLLDIRRCIRLCFLIFTARISHKH